MSSRKTGNSNEDNPNSDIVKFLLELANYERNVSRNTFKANAYKKAAGVIANLPRRLKSGEEARKLDGVGEKIAKKIDEFLTTGKLQKLENIRNDDSVTAINLLTRVVGIGPAKAKDLWDAGIKTIEDLQANQDMLTKGQKIGLAHFEDFEKRIPRAEIQQIEKLLRQQIKNIDSKYDITICGSYRRGLPTSGDIDVLLTHDDHLSTSSPKKKVREGEAHHMLQDVVAALEKTGLITDTLSLGESKFMGVCKLPKEENGEETFFRRLDIRLIPKDQYYCGILYFTGSDVFNKQMRARALEKGFTLNEYSIRALDNLNSPLPVSSEEDIFDYIGYEYKAPHERNL